MSFLLNVFDGGTDRAGRCRPFVADDGLPVWMRSGQQEAAHETVDEWHTDKRLGKQAVLPENLLGEQPQHRDPTLDWRRMRRQAGRRIDLRSRAIT